jgi:hypothetical protein
VSITTIIEAIGGFLGLLRRFDRGDARAEKKLKDILPSQTYTRMVRERERSRDIEKFGGSR